MAHREPIDITKENRRLGEWAGPLASTCFLVGGAGLVAAAVLDYALSPYGTGDVGQPFLRLQFAYLQAFMYFLSITLGGLFFTMALYVCGGKWGVVIRRIPELAAQNATVLAVLAIPIIACVLSGSGLYEWASHAQANGHGDAGHAELLEHKKPWLNPTFFTIRMVIYFAVWIFLGTYLFRRSVETDETGDPSGYQRAGWISPLGIIAFALTTTFAVFDLMMSLTPTWYSTIYGVYYFAGCNVAIYAFSILAYRYIQSKGVLTKAVTTEHYHDLGKLLFTFIFFWGYVAFSQYMLIWYGNMPEETAWYQSRQFSVAWVIVSCILLFGHLIIPFPGMFSRWVKRDKFLLNFWAVWMLVAHWVDMYYNVQPTWAGRVSGNLLEPIDPPIPLVEILCTIGVGGIWLGALVRKAATVSLVPEKDPNLDRSLVFENF